MSATNTQRELIDFLWDWTTPLGNWSKLLVEIVVNKQSTLDDAERQRVFAYYLQDIGFEHTPPLAPITLAKPSFTTSSKEVVLTKLYEVKGVNRLADDQLMEFSPNITVVYGNNGVGKTGYSRVLKSQGYSFDNNIEILSNVDNAQVGQSAKIEFSTDGSPYIVEWEGGRPESDLNSISVFNSDCVNISLSNNRQLLIAPKGFYLFKLVTDELLAMSNMHTHYCTLYPTNLHWNEQLNEGTQQKTFIDGLVHDSDMSKLDELCLFTEQNQTDLLKKEDDLRNLNKTVLEASVVSN